MAVVTPDGIVGKVIASYPTAAQVQLITDPGFAAGVVSQKNRVIGTLKGQGRSDCIVDYVQIEQRVDTGEWFYTSGDDRIFPKGLPVGQASVVRSGKTFKDIYLNPAGFQRGLDEVLVIVEGVHQRIPEDPTAAVSGPVKMLPPPPDSVQNAESASAAKSLVTDADRLKERYREIGEGQSHKFGEGMTAPNFNKTPVVPAPKLVIPGTNPPGGATVRPGTVPAPATTVPSGASRQQQTPAPTTTPNSPPTAQPKAPAVSP
jgi:rod shape-determining protein MreC